MSLARCSVQIPCTKQINSNFNLYKDQVPSVTVYKTQSRPAIQIVKKNHFLMRRDSTGKKLLVDKINESVSNGLFSE
jgi:hypothetical protein